MSEWQGARGWAGVNPGWAALGIGLNGASTGPQAGQTLNNNRVALRTTFTRNGVNRTVGAIDLEANGFFSEIPPEVVNKEVHPGDDQRGRALAACGDWLGGESGDLEGAACALVN